MNPKALFLFAALGLGVWGCDKPKKPFLFALKGKVVDATDGRPVSNVRIKLYNYLIGSKNIYTTMDTTLVSDSSGLFETAFMMDSKKRWYYATCIHNNKLYYELSSEYISPEEPLLTLKLKRMDFYELTVKNESPFDTIFSASAEFSIQKLFKIDWLVHDTSKVVSQIPSFGGYFKLKYVNAGVETNKMIWLDGGNGWDTAKYSIAY